MNSRLFRSEMNINDASDSDENDDDSQEEKRMNQLRETGYTFTAVNEKEDSTDV